MINIFDIGHSYTFSVLNLIFILLVLAGYWISKRLIKIKLKKITQGKGITIQGRELTLNHLISQGLGFITVVLLFFSVGYGNPFFTLDAILSYKIINNPDEIGYQLKIGQIISVLVVLFITRIVINIVKVLLYKYFRNRHWLDESKRYTIIQLSRYILYTIGVVIAIKIMIGNITGVLIGASALFVGLGLGLREFFTDIIGGIIIFSEGNIKVSDIVELNNEPCKIEKINLRTSQVKTLNGKIIIVPNSKLTQDNVINWSLSDKSTRFLIEINVAYGSDTEKVRTLLYDAALKHSKVDKNNPITVLINDFNERGIQFQLFFWVNKTWESPVIQSDVRFTIDKLFREHKINIPAPQREVLLTQNQFSSEK